MRLFHLIWKLAFDTLRSYSADHATLFAAAISFYSIISLAPLLVIAVTIAGTVYSEQAARGEITHQIEGIVGTDGASVIELVLANAAGPGSGTAAILSGAVLLFSASLVFSQLRTALSVIFGTSAKTKGLLGFILNKLIAIAFVIGIGLFVVASLASSTFLSRLEMMATRAAPRFLAKENLIEFFGMTLLFSLIFAVVFRVLPAAQLRGISLWVGSLITSLLFNIGRIGVGIYLGRSAVGSSYGAAGSLLVLLLWIYYSSLTMLLGAEFTKTLASYRGDVVGSNAGIAPSAVDSQTD